MKFDLNDLTIFVAAIEGGSLTAAAARHNIVVAAVSARLRRLEAAVSLKLFERTGRGVRPTLAGDMLLRHARKILGEARQIEVELDEFAYGRSGRVRLLSNTNMLAEHLPRAVGTFLAYSPDISVIVEDRPSLEVITMLQNGDADIGIVAASADMTGLERWRFVPDQLVVVRPPDFPQLGEQPIEFSRALDFGMIGLREKAALSQFLRRLANELGRKINVRMEMDGFEGICRMVEAGAGLAIVPQSAALRYSNFMEFGIVQIREDWAKREIYLCVKNESQLPRYAKNLLAHLRDYAATYSDN